MKKKNLIVYLLFFLFGAKLFALEQMKFKRISPVGGFGIEAICSITQDSLGMIWFCSHEGLYRYNSNEFKSYTLTNGKPLSLSNEDFEFVYNDSQNHLWLGTKNGLFQFNEKFDRFELAKIQIEKDNKPFTRYMRFMAEDDQNRIWIAVDGQLGIYDEEKLSFTPYADLNEKISCLISDEKGQLWLGGFGKVYRYNSEQGKFVLFSHLGKEMVNDILVDREQNVWIATEGDGVYCLDSIGQVKSHYNNAVKENTIIVDNYVRKLLCDKDGIIWIGTYSGLSLLDAKNGKIKHIRAGVDGGLPNNSIKAMFTDHNHNIWLGTWSGGLALMNYNDHKFHHYKQDEKGKGLSNNLISSFCEDRKGNLWIGTEKGGLDYWNRKTGEFVWIHYDTEQKRNDVNNIKALETDENENLWIGTHWKGLWKRDNKTGEYQYYLPEGKGTNSIAHNSVYALEYDPNKGLWIGTSGEGLDYLDFKSGKFSHYPRVKGDALGLKSSFISSLLIDSSGYLWVGTTSGLSLFDREKKSFIPIQIEGDTKNIFGKAIWSIYEDSSHAIWVGTDGSGLFRIDIVNKSIENYAENEGLNANRIYGINEDESHNLWISSSNGIFCRRTNENRFVAYDMADGLQSNIFSKGAVLKLSSGEIAFGGTNGFNIFEPSQIIDNTEIFKPLISELTIYNATVTPESHPKVLKKSIYQATEIVLNHTQKSFGLEFCYPSYLMSEKNHFKYQLEGIDETWIEVGTDRRNVTYSNLYSGEYNFRLQACNNDGVWSSMETTLKIKVEPAPWLTWWAFVCYAVFILMISWLTIRFYWEKEKQKNLIQMEKDKLDEVHKMKLQFFTNISHELRTPLTLILGPVQQLLSIRETTMEMQRSFKIINRNAQRLLHLVNQLLDFRKLENEGMKVQSVSGDLAELVRTTGEMFALMANQKNIDFKMNIQETGSVLFDKDKLEKVLFNLLSNAFKYTPNGGCITLRIDLANTQREDVVSRIVLHVSNTGLPIPKEVLPEIFLPYYQYKGDQKNTEQGTGIGLALTKELVDVMGGEIYVESNEKATIFRVGLPVQKTIDIPEIRKEVNHGLKDIADALRSEASITIDKNNENRKLVKILVIEDNLELLDFLVEKLQTQFRVFKAVDGKQGFEKAKNENPDVIVSDVMMPEMGGLDLCCLIKTTDSLSHIPVILLTARSSQENQIEGLNCGADAYIQKPFDTEYLIASIWNLYHQRKELRKAFGQKISVDSQEIELPSEDEQFLKSAAAVVEKYMENEDFNVAVFAQEIGLGKTLLYQKMKSTAGMSVNEFILSLRMSRAKQLLRDSELNIAQISMQVGFKNPNYFSTCFKNQFKMSPKKYYLLIRK